MKLFLLENKRELCIAGFLLGAFFWLPPLLRLLDPTSAQLDAGWLHTALLGALFFYIALMMGWGGVKLACPTIAHWLQEQGFKRAWDNGDNGGGENQIVPWRVRYALAVMAFMFTAAMAALFGAAWVLG